MQLPHLPSQSLNYFLYFQINFRLPLEELQVKLQKQEVKEVTRVTGEN